MFKNNKGWKLVGALVLALLLAMAGALSALYLFSKTDPRSFGTLLGEATSRVTEEFITGSERKADAKPVSKQASVDETPEKKPEKTGQESGGSESERKNKSEKNKEQRKPGQPMPYNGSLESMADINIRDAVLEAVTTDLKYPWAMEFISDEELLINEFAGAVKRVNTKTGVIVDVTGFPEIPHGKGQLGLMDLELHPDFEKNGWVYFTHASRKDNQSERYATTLSRAKLQGNSLSGFETLLVAAPYTKSTSNLGGILAFDDKGFLYMSVGDRSLNYMAQDGKRLQGKILRLDDLGQAPEGNPFVSDPDVDDRVYALGVRNPQGLVFDERTDRLYEAEHGPMGGDEINVIEAGKNYGWPTISYGDSYSTAKVGMGTAYEGMEQPLYYYLPSIAISPLTIYRGEMFPEWEGALLVGALKGAHISRLSIVEGVVKSERGILSEVKGRVRDVKVGPDGSVYILVQNGGRLLRLYRDAEVAGVKNGRKRNGKNVYRQVCATCHDSGQDYIPQLSNSADWAQRLEKGKETLYNNTVNGIGAMPPMGLCDTCSKKEIRGAVNYMLKKLN